MCSLFTLLVLLLIVLMYLKSRESKLPPGPKGLPILGNLLEIKGRTYLKLSELADKYGDIYTLKLAHRTAIVLSSVNLMKQIFGSDPGTGTFHSEAYLAISNGPFGILHTEGRGQTEVRHFCIKNLKQFGFGRKSCWEPFTLAEADKSVAWIREQVRSSGQEPVLSVQKIRSEMQNSANSSVWSIMTRGDKDHRHYDPKIVHLLENLMESVQKVTIRGLTFCTALKHICPKWCGYEELKEASDNFFAHIRAEYGKHVKSFRKGELRDLMDCYVEHLQTVDDPMSSFYGEFGLQNAVSSIGEMLIGSWESSGSIITWAMIYLATNPKIQEKLRKEIRSVLGFDRDPGLEDLANMPYTNATILEIFRFSSMTAYGIPHQMLDDVECEGYVIPKGTIVIPLIYHVHFRKDTWKDPENFRPERFLEDEKLKKYVIPFGVGKRSCPGETLARDTIFLYLVKIMQNFEFCMAQGISKEDYCCPVDGLFLAPKDNKLMVRELSYKTGN